MLCFDIGFYIAKRAYLTEALISCGLEHGSKRAKELAIEHILDIIYLHIKIGAPFKKARLVLVPRPGKVEGGRGDDICDRAVSCRERDTV